MASLTTYPHGFIVQFHTMPAGPKHTLRLPGLRRREAETVCGHIEALVAATRSNTAPPASAATWAAGLSDRMYGKLVAAGLLAARATPTVTSLFALCLYYVERRTDLKPATLTILNRTRRSLVAYLGVARDAASITRADALDYQRHLKAKHSAATAHMYVKKARQIFADAVDRGLLTANPFRKLKLGSASNPDRMVYVPAADVLKVIDATADTEWKLIIGLARFAACRVPSEIRDLKFTDINLDAGRMTLRSPKTEHHEGRGSRVVPIAPVLARMLTDALNAAEDGAVYVLPRLRRVTNHTTTAKKLITRAGLAVWEKTFQNLRASCETDWTMMLPIHAACAFAGNTQAVALRHYLLVTDAHFRTVSGRAAESGAGSRDVMPDNPQTQWGVPVRNTLETEGFEETDWLPREPNLPAHLLTRRLINPKAVRNAVQRLLIAAPFVHDATLTGIRRGLAGAGGAR